jgi:TolB protein
MDIYLARLDRADDRFVNLTSESVQPDFDPVFSPDGSTLAYVTQRESMDFIAAKSSDDLSFPGRILGQGRDPAWTADGSALLAIMRTSHDSYLMIYPFGQGGSTVAGLPQPSRLAGIGWSQRDVVADLTAAGMVLQTLPPDSGDQLNGNTVSDGNIPLISLNGVDAPIPKLSQSIVDEFNQLRDRVVLETGWDFLGVLDNAFVGVNDPMPPGFAHVDWLYTGRGFCVNTSAVHARWLEIVREEHGGMTYWRVFVRASRQDGSLGEPLRSLPWDIEARFGSDPSDYDGGGRSRTEIPAGYYIDFTELAADYGFERQPALVNWRTFFPGARFGEFVHTDDLTWYEAMLEIYPPSAFITPTPYRTPYPGR